MSPAIYQTDLPRDETRLEGLEPPTCSLGKNHSVQMSYRRNMISAGLEPAAFRFGGGRSNPLSYETDSGAAGIEPVLNRRRLFAVPEPRLQ